MVKPMATAKQIGFIHGLAARASMDEDSRRDFLQRETGQRSCKSITAAQAASVIDKLRAAVPGVRGLDTPVAKKLRALWIAGYNLGLVRDRGDRAMLAFVERQTGITHPRFMREPGAGSAAVEGLKSWLARDGKVEWPGKDAQGFEHKRAVLVAQWVRLIEIGAVKPFATLAPSLEVQGYAFRVVGKNGWEFFGDDDYDLAANALGRKLRAWLARRAEAAAAASQQEDAA